MNSENNPLNRPPSDKEGYLPVPGGQVFYKIIGPDRPGIPLLALHGGPGATSDYLEPLSVLFPDRPVVFYDQLGGGKSDRPEDTSLWTIDRFCSELGEVRKALNLNRVHLLGQCWGSVLAVAYLLDSRPVGVMSLICSSPFLSAPRFIADQKSYLKMLPEIKQNTILACEEKGAYQSAEYQQAMTFYYQQFVCRLDPWPEVINRTFQNMGLPVYQYMWGPSEFTATGTLKEVDFVDRLPEINPPTLFICGQYDECPPETASYYQKHLPGSELKVIPEASHMNHLEQPEIYGKIVRDFLSRVEQSFRSRG